MAPNSSAKIVACLLVIVLIISLTLTIYMPRFSCFYEMRGIDNYTTEIYGGIFGCCFAFTLLSLFLLLKWPHSTRVKYITQLLFFIFIFGTSVFGICGITIMEVAQEKLSSSANSTNDYSVFAIRAATKFLSPDRTLSSDWAQVALQAADPNVSFSASVEEQAICRLQKQFQCMMWESDRDTCTLPSPSSSSSTSTFFEDALQSTTTVPCLTCGIFTMNVTEYNRPISCMEAMVDCFVNGRHKYATSVSSDPSDPTKYAYKADRYMLTIGTALLFVFSLVALWKNGFRSTGVEPARYGEFEHGSSGEYRPMRSELVMYD
jgi:hypothetical protein